ncbi:lipid-A-disaccharide synthase [Thermodesulfobacteriota bacterium]
MGKKSVMIIAGEASGDLHGSNLVKAMHEKDDTLFFFGIGGQALKDAGVKIFIDAPELSVVGITEVFSKIPSLYKGITLAKRLLKSLHPDLLILIDFPDFNLHVARTAKKHNIPVLYYISPQIWAWRSGRIKKIGERVDHVAVIFPFEEDFYKRYNIPVTFVGHPLFDAYPPSTGKQLEKAAEDSPVIGLLPGSRDREVARHLPVMLDAALILTKRIKNAAFIVSRAPSVKRVYVEEAIREYRGLIDIKLTTDNVQQIFDQCRFVVASSGTVTLESAISGTPMVIIYKVSPVSAWVGRALIRVKNVGLVNLIAGREVVPELLQNKASPENIADTVYSMLNDAAGLERLRNELLETRDLLGGPGASKRVADIAMNLL